MPSIADILAKKKSQAEVAAINQEAYEEPSLKETVNVPPTPEERQEPQPEKGNGEDKKPNLSFESLLRDYPTLRELQQSTAWRLLGLAQRVQIGREYAKLGQSRGTQNNDNSGIVYDQAATRDSEESSQPASFGTVTAYSPPHTILNRYLDLGSLKASPLWEKMDLAKKALLAREYSKQAQLAAIEAAKLQRGLEKEQFEEERTKALSQASSLQPEKRKHQAFSLDIKLNEKQQLAVEYAKAGKSFVLTGAAGTGKTTACREIARAFLVAGDLGRHTFRLEDGEQYTSHGIAFCSYTRRATANIRRALHQDPTLEEELNVNVVTVHRLLEYYPEFFPDPKNPEKTTMRFIPRRTAQNPLDIKVLVIEEASMLGLDLYEKLFAALRTGVIIVFVGDINQLPPVFGKSIMNYALGQLPIVELTDVYRQALDSGIIQNAHSILKGIAPVDNKDTRIVTGNRKEHTGQERMAQGLGGMFFKLWEAKEYDPEQDIILSPWNKQPCGTDNLNNWIAQFLGEQRKAMVYEVLAGRRKLYLAIGDRVMYEKQDGMITAVRHNLDYLGKPPNPAGTDLTRFGMRKMQEGAEHEDFEAMAHGYANINIDEVPDEEKKLQASHVVEITLDSGEKAYLRAVGDYAEQIFSLGYVLTVHKAQGCEWRKVYVILHRDHTLGGFLTRELLYTAITRAREKLVLICKPEVLAKSVKQQSIKGNTLQEKIASINSGAQNIGTYPVTKPLKEKHLATL